MQTIARQRNCNTQVRLTQNLKDIEGKDTLKRCKKKKPNDCSMAAMKKPTYMQNHISRNSLSGSITSLHVNMPAISSVSASRSEGKSFTPVSVTADLFECD